MMTIIEARRECEQTINDAYVKLYHHYLENFKKTGMMDKDVIRLSDGKRGRILLFERTINSKYPQFEFHLYTKSGEISVNQSGYILDMNIEGKDGITTILNEYKLAN